MQRRMVAAHTRYARDRWNLLSEEDEELVKARGWEAPLRDLGVSGMRPSSWPEAAKCLHAQYAHWLALTHDHLIDDAHRPLPPSPTPLKESAKGMEGAEEAVVGESSNEKGACGGIVMEQGEGRQGDEAVSSDRCSNPIGDWVHELLQEAHDDCAVE